jgi:hypothetical protein
MKDEGGPKDTGTRRHGDTGMFSARKFFLLRTTQHGTSLWQNVPPIRGPSVCRPRHRVPVSPRLRVSFPRVSVSFCPPSSFILHPSSFSCYGLHHLIE